MAVCLCVVLASTAVVRACPSCKSAVADTAQSNGDDNGGLADQVAADTSLAVGFNYSIVFMLAVPYLTVAGLGGMFYYHMRKRSAAVIAATSPSSRPPER